MLNAIDPTKAPDTTPPGKTPNPEPDPKKIPGNEPPSKKQPQSVASQARIRERLRSVLSNAGRMSLH